LDQERLWAPWRLRYIKREIEPDQEPRELPFLPGGDADCFICRAVVDDRDRENLVIGRGGHTVSILNRYPYNNGHLLVAPKRHLADLDDLDPQQRAECLEELNRLTVLLRKRVNAEGFNIGLNLGRVAGAGVPGHLHWHLVPRWFGDTNFMPTVAATKVIPQSLDELWQILTNSDGK